MFRPKTLVLVVWMSLVLRCQSSGGRSASNFTLKPLNEALWCPVCSSAKECAQPVLASALCLKTDGCWKQYRLSSESMSEFRILVQSGCGREESVCTFDEDIACEQDDGIQMDKNLLRLLASGKTSRKSSKVSNVPALSPTMPDGSTEEETTLQPVSDYNKTVPNDFSARMRVTTSVAITSTTAKVVNIVGRINAGRLEQFSDNGGSIAGNATTEGSENPKFKSAASSASAIVIQHILIPIVAVLIKLIIMY